MMTLQFDPNDLAADKYSPPAQLPARSSDLNPYGFVMFLATQASKLVRCALLAVFP